jgi:hypothetical protein
MVVVSPLQVARNILLDACCTCLLHVSGYVFFKTEHAPTKWLDFGICIFRRTHTCGEPSSFAMAGNSISPKNDNNGQNHLTHSDPELDSCATQAFSVAGSPRGGGTRRSRSYRHNSPMLRICSPLSHLSMIIAFLVTFPPAAVPDGTTHANARPCIKMRAEASGTGKHIRTCWLDGLVTSSKMSLDQESCSMSPPVMCGIRRGGGSSRGVAFILPPLIKREPCRIATLRGGRGSESSEEEDDGGYEEAASEGSQSSQAEEAEGWGGVDGGDDFKLPEIKFDFYPNVMHVDGDFEWWWQVQDNVRRHNIHGIHLRLFSCTVCAWF